MAATVHSTARFGVVDDSTATGLYIASLSYSYSSEQGMVKDHEGFTVGLSVYDDRTEISADGVVKTKGSGLVASIGDTVTLLNESDDGDALNDGALMSTSVGTAAPICTGGGITRSNTEFETGSLTLVFYPLVATS